MNNQQTSNQANNFSNNSSNLNGSQGNGVSTTIHNNPNILLNSKTQAQVSTAAVSAADRKSVV